MKHIQVRYEKDWQVLAETEQSQSAVMVIPPGNSEGGPKNRHEDSDQWLYVVAGRGTAVVEKNRVDLQQGSLVLIEAGEKHEIKNTGEEELRTLNFYAPPPLSGADSRLSNRESVPPAY